MTIHGDIEWCSCGRVRPARKDTGLCEACSAVERYKRQREQAQERAEDRIG